MFSAVLFSVKGGIETYTIQLANALSPIMRIAYAIDIHKKEQVQDLIDPKVILLEYRRPRIREVWGWMEIHRLAQKIIQFQPDIFHLQSDGIWESVLLRFLGNLPIVNTVHDPIKHIDQRTCLNNWTMKDAIKRSNGWVVHSEGLKKIFVKKNKVSEDRILVHPHGVYDFYCNFAQPLSNKEKYILFFGRLRVNKGLDLFLKSFNRVKEQIPEWRVVIAGNGNFPKHALPCKNRDRITIHNRYIPDAEAADLFSKAGVIVLPYRHGSQSGVLALAAAFACPVLATRVGNIPEILVNRKHALLVEPENIDELATGLLEITTDDYLREMLGKNLNKIAVTDWSWEEIAEKTLKFYRHCI